MIAAVVLSKWDNVIGPKTLKAWGPRADDNQPANSSGLKFSWAGEVQNRNQDSDELDEACEAAHFEFEREESPEIICISDKSSSSSIVVLSKAASDKTNLSNGSLDDTNANQLESSQFTVLEPELHQLNFDDQLPEEEGRMKIFLCDSVKYVTEHTVIACLSKPCVEELSLIKTSCFVVPDFYSVMICVTFYVEEFVTDCGALETSYSLSVISDIDNESTLMSLRCYIESYLKETAKFIKSLPEIDSLVDDIRLEARVNKLLNHTQSLVKQSFTSLVKAELLRNLLIQADFDTILTSHLQSFGNSYVYGNKYPLVDQVVSFLRHFLWSDSQKQCCRIFSEFDQEFFCPGLYVQGFVFSRVRRKPTLRDILLNPYPVSLIDLSVSPIQTIHSSSYVEHIQRRNRPPKSQPQSFVQALTSKAPRIKKVQSQPSRLVSSLLEKLASNGPNQWEDLIKRFKRSLFLKGLHLLNAKDSLEKSELNVHEAVVNKDLLRDQLMVKLGLTNADFLIILSAMTDFDTLSDDQILAKLKEYNLPVVPVTDATRKVLINRLKKAGASAAPTPSKGVSNGVSAATPKAKEAQSPARKGRKRSIAPAAQTDTDGEEVSAVNYTDNEIDKTFAEFGWAKPKITEKNRLSLQKKINHERARSRSRSASRVASSTRIGEDEEEEDENEDSMEVEETVEVEIPARRTTRKLVSDTVSVPSPAKIKKISEESVTVETSSARDVYRYQQPTVTVVFNSPYPAQQEKGANQPEQETSVPPSPNPPSVAASSRLSAASDASPTSSVFITGQDASVPSSYTRGFSTSSYAPRVDTLSSPRTSGISSSASQDQYGIRSDYTGRSQGTALSYSLGGTGLGGRHEVPSRRPLGSAITSSYRSSETVTDSSLKTKSTGATQTTMADEGSAYVADLQARLFGKNSVVNPRPVNEPSVPFSKQSPTPYNKPLTPIAPRMDRNIQTPARKVFVEEQASEPEDVHTPEQKSKLNTTFNSPAVYRFGTPGRTGLSRYIPSFMRREGVKAPVFGSPDSELSSSEEEEDKQEARRPVRVSRPPVKVEPPSASSDHEVFSGVLWAKYLPHLCIGFFAVIVFVYLQLRNERQGENDESIVLNILTKVAWNVVAIFALGFGAWIAVKGRNFIIRQRQQEDAELLQLTQRVIDLLVENAEDCKRDGRPNDSFLPRNHIRDSLIPVNERKAKSKLWQKVVAFVEDNESRIRKENRDFQGEMYEVWRWLPNVHGSADKREKVWQGSAFNVDESSVNTPPAKSPTPCLKIRHMFDPSTEDPTSDWQKRVSDDLLEKCSDAKIVHMAIDTSSKDGVVYVKCNSKEDAKKVYKNVHGWWYGGKILVVKYVTLQRYYERFPLAVSSKDVMEPSYKSFSRRM